MPDDMRITQSAVECDFPLRVPAFQPQVSMRLRVEALHCGALRVTRTLREEFLPVASNVVIPQELGELTVTQDDRTVRACAGGITAAIDRAYGSITFYDVDGGVLLREDQRCPCILQEKSVLVNTFSGQGEITLRQSVDGVRASMTPKEYDLLFYLVKNKGLALSRDKLLEEVWGYDFFGDDRTVDTHIKMLRGSLGPYRTDIVTLRGMGYKFEYTQN